MFACLLLFFLGGEGVGCLLGRFGVGGVRVTSLIFLHTLLFFSQIRELMEDDPERNKDLLEVRLTAELLGCMNHSTPSLSCVSPLPC